MHPCGIHSGEAVASPPPTFLPSWRAGQFLRKAIPAEPSRDIRDVRRSLCALQSVLCSLSHLQTMLSSCCSEICRQVCSKLMTLTPDSYFPFPSSSCHRLTFQVTMGSNVSDPFTSLDRLVTSWTLLFPLTFSSLSFRHPQHPLGFVVWNCSISEGTYFRPDCQA